MAKSGEKTTPWHKTVQGRFFTVETNRRRLIAGGILTVCLLALTLWNAESYFQNTHGTLLLILSLCACPIIGLILMFQVRRSHWFDTAVSTVVVLLLPIVAMTMVECLNGVFTWDWTPETLILNYILYLMFYGIVYIFSGDYRLPMLIVNPLFFLLSVANFYVMAFRGTPFVPMDFLAVGTAANVVVSYQFFINYQMVISVLLLAFIIVTALRLTSPRRDIIGQISTRAFFGILIISVMGIYFFTDQYAEAGLAPDFWNQARGYRNTGVVMNFSLNTKYLFTTKPDGYNADEIEDIVTEGDTEEKIEDNETPNIIVIMNESLADMNVLGDVNTNKDYMPFLHSLNENTVKGQLYVPVIGSGTSNTEYEFLTGVSTSFFPAGSNAYMLYVKRAMPTLTSTLLGQGYTAKAFHPYYANGWNRTAVYDYFGFSSFSSIRSVISTDILTNYQNSGYDAKKFESDVEAAYPGQNVLIRRYVSDSFNYKKVIKMYKNRDKSKPFFLFNVTMQNHGSYTEQADNFNQQIYVTDEEGNRLTKVKANGDTVDMYSKANQYYSLIKESDTAFKELVAYFKKQKQKTIICLFGDHQPNIETEYIQSLMGTDSLYTLSIEENQKRYITPFYIWANYDIEEKSGDTISANYLSSYLLDCIGARTTAYQRYLLRLSETLPVITTIGIKDKNGVWYENGTSTPYDSLIRDYEKVAYNLVSDKSNRKDELFYLATAS